MFVLYCLMVPKIAFFSFGQNLFNFLIIVALLFNYRYKTLVFKPLAPFIFLYLAQFIMIPFHDKVPYGIQVNAFRIEFMNTILLPFAMINVAKKDDSSLYLFNKILMIVIIVNATYSLVLTQMTGSNPYITLLDTFRAGSHMDADYFSKYWAAKDSGRLFGRISGVFVHPMQNGLFLCFSVIFLLSIFSFNRALKSQIPLIVIMFSTFLAILCIGIRTSIVATGIGLLVFLLLERRVKVFFIGIISIIILLIIVQKVPGAQEYVTSIFDTRSGAVRGSSFEMRLVQLNGCLREISHNYFFGNGFNWTAYYTSLYIKHPIMLAFESLLIVILCNGGFLGAVIWTLMIVMYIQSVFQNFSDKHYRYTMITLIVIYLTYSVITGEYGYMRYFLIFYAVMWINGIQGKAQCHKVKRFNVKAI
ncbi:hypothetical protein [uncultured Desulfobacter sp.]|uniref:hypothetical protein n=1 Tax=uncultured Desulfobacter sp. TaxID=240139 RepID=UPI0029F45F1F|nr:hypothetical protein [uncultured Desulfobacter sp.]